MILTLVLFEIQHVRHVHNLTPSLFSFHLMVRFRTKRRNIRKILKSVSKSYKPTYLKSHSSILLR